MSCVVLLLQLQRVHDTHADLNQSVSLHTVSEDVSWAGGVSVAPESCDRDPFNMHSAVRLGWCHAWTGLVWKPCLFETFYLSVQTFPVLSTPPQTKDWSSISVASELTSGVILRTVNHSIECMQEEMRKLPEACKCKTKPELKFMMKTLIPTDPHRPWTPYCFFFLHWWPDRSWTVQDLNISFFNSNRPTVFIG